MKHDAKFFYLIDVFRIGEFYEMRSNGKLFAIKYFNALLRNIHPSAILATKIHNIERFEPIILELCMFS